MEKIENHIIPGSKNKSIAIDILYEKEYHLKPIVIFCHGFKGFKNWGHFDLISEEFVKNGFTLFKFNFSYNGTTPDQPIDFADLNAFEENNYSIELNDLGIVIDFIEKNAAEYCGNANKIYLLGHSRGGGIVILKAKDDARIKKLVTWASVKDWEDFLYAQDLELWKKETVVYTFNSRTQQNMPLGYQLFEDYIENKNRLNIPQAAKEIEIPWLIVHGKKDTSVPVDAAMQLHQWNPKSELVLIENGDHTFGGKHPWTENELPKDSKLAVAETVSFLKR